MKAAMTNSGRRRFMAGASACGCAMAFGTAAWAATPAHAAAMTPAEAIAALMRGNKAFVNDKPAAPRISRERRLEISAGQSPFAVLVGCSDSRVSPELLFGRGLGDLFIVRIAGNSVDQTALGSIEYGVAELKCPLVMVLGHERCGAVQAAVKAVTDDQRYPGAIQDMVSPIIPAVLAAQRMPGDLVKNAVQENARRIARQLRDRSRLIGEPLQNGKLQVISAYYSLNDGSVELLET